MNADLVDDDDLYDRPVKRGRGRPLLYGEDSHDVSVRMPRDIYESLRRFAKMFGCSVNAVAVEALDEYTKGERES